MRRPWWLVIVLGGLIAAGPAAHSDADPLDRNRRLLEKWRADPEHYQRLLSDLRAFHAMPPQRQEHLRAIDRQLHELDLPTQARLWAVLDRYSAWLERLPEEQRQHILSADGAERLKRIRELREQEWIDRLPPKIREEVTKLPPDRRAVRLADLRREERAQKLYWLRTPAAAPHSGAVSSPPGNYHPTKLIDFPPVVQKFVYEHLTPKLTPAEREHLHKAEGKWPDLVRAVRELADRHPVLPPGPWGEITNGAQLYKRMPAEAVRVFWGGKEKRRLKSLAQLNNKWPEYALAAAEMLHQAGKKAPPLGASRPHEFPEEVKVFIRESLLPSLNQEQKENLRKVEGAWPEYPRRLLELARQKHLVIPGMSLPGPRELWEAAQAALPDVPGRTLFDFAVNELSEEERAGLQLSTTDPQGGREKLKRLYFKRKPNHKSEQAKLGDAGP